MPQGILKEFFFFPAERHQVIASVLLFVAQLGPIPPSFDSSERKEAVRLFLGPSAWATAAALKGLQSAFSAELLDVRMVAQATQAQVARLEDALNGGFRVAPRLSASRFCMSDHMHDHAPLLSISGMADRSGWLKLISD